MLKFLLFFISITTFAQTFSIKGTIEDASSSEKLPFVSVYINNTAKGTFTNEKGDFQLNNISLTKVELVASMIGYESFRKSIEFKNENEIFVKIVLKPSENALNEVVITGKKDKKWQNQYNRFLKEFLGNTPFARQCELKNGHILQFDENKETSDFSAKANLPLEIENQALGYKVFFELKQFKINPAKTSITGLTRFEQIKSEKNDLIKKWQTNRQKAYLGSEKHFFTTIFDKSYEKAGFMIYRVNPNFHSDKKVVSSIEEQLGKRLLPFDSTNVLILERLQNNNRRILLPKEIEVLYTKQTNEFSYRDAPFPVSWIYSQMPLEVSAMGNISNNNMVEFSGEMSNRRIAEILPLDYEPNENIEIEEEKTVFAQNSYSDYQEFPYFHFNKPYFVSGEKIWFKVYMNYRNPVLRDSLSKVLYVDLINSQDKIIQKKLIKIKNGVGFGDFSLPKDGILQNYKIRAYTAWMLNFGLTNVFQKEIPVVLPAQKLVGGNTNLKQKNELFEVLMEKSKTDSSENISLKIKLKKPENRANFSVSVVNAEAVDEEKENIMNFKPNFGAFAFKNKFSPEQNIEIRGKVSSLQKTDLAILNQSDGSIRVAETDSLGSFEVDNFDFQDSLVVGIQAEKKAIVSLDSLLSPPIFQTKKPNFQIKPSKITTNDFQINENNKVLDEVVVKANKEVIAERKEYLDRFNKIYGNPDVSIGEKEIEERKGVTTNLLNLLQGRIPGLKVVERLSPNGFYETAIEIRVATTSTIQSSTSPLLLLDGVRMENTNAFLEVNPYNIERIDVMKSAASTAIFGSRGYNGVIAVYTKTGSNKRKKFENQKADYQLFTLQGFASPSVFKSTQNSTTIFWQPNFSTNEKGETEILFSINQKGKFRIVVEGMNNLGEKGRMVLEVGRD